MEDNEDFYGAFFIAEHAPLIFNQEQPDMILLDPTVDQPSRQRNMFAAQNKERNIFSRNICSFKNGTPLLKHCAPWGEFSVLCEDSFILEKKCFGADGEVTSVVVKTRSAPKREYMLCPAFFAGWTDKATLEQYYSY